MNSMYNVKISTKENDYTLPNKKRMQAKSVYGHYRCLSCYDKLNIYADIVCGDPWGIPIKTVGDGWTVIIVRNDKGRTLIQNAVKDNVISCIPVEREKIFIGQGIYSELIPRVYAAKECSEKNGWLYPYTIDNIDVSKTTNIPSQSYKQTARRLKYCRKFYFFKTDKNIALAVKLKKTALLCNLFLSYFYRIIYVVLKKFKLARICAAYVRRLKRQMYI